MVPWVYVAGRIYNVWDLDDTCHVRTLISRVYFSSELCDFLKLLFCSTICASGVISFLIRFFPTLELLELVL